MQASINNNKKINCSINCNQNVNCSINSTNNIQADTCAQNDINANSTQRGPQGIPGEAATIEVGTVTTGAAGSDVIITNSGTENAAVFNFTIPRGDKGEQGEQGVQGETGNGIASVELTSTSGLVDTYTITFTDGNTTTFNVTNGQDGNGIVSIQKTSTSGLVDTYTITFDNGNTETFTVTNGQKGDTGSAATISVGSTTTGAAGTSASVTNSGTSSAAVLDFVIPQGVQGETGATGNGISSIAKTSTSGLVDTYTITFTNGTTTTFTVTNGQDGASTISQLTDVDLTGLSNGDVLVYNSTTQEWEAEAQSGGVTDVEVNGESVVTGGVAEIDLTGYQEKLTAGTDLEIVGGGIQLPSGYTALEYITASGAQYIVTNFIPDITKTYTFQTEVLFSILPTLYGQYQEMYFAGIRTPKRFQPVGGYSSRFVGGLGDNWTYFGNTLIANYWYPIMVTIANGSQNFNGTATSYTTNATWTTPLFLFAQQKDNEILNYTVGSMKTFKIFEASTLIHQYVPCKHGDIIGMYDTVEDEFFTNSGTGTFLGGAEVSASTINFTNESGYVKSSELATVATTGSYNDLTNKPTIGNGTVTFTQGGVTKGTITMNQSSNATIALEQGGGGVDLVAGTDLEIVPLLPSGYTQLKSITATGSQYIDTGLWLTDNFKAEIVGKFTSTSGNQCLLGSSITTTGATYKNIVLAIDGSKYFTNSGNPWLTNQTNSTATLDTNKHTFVVEVTSSNAKIKVDSIENTGTYESSSIEENLFIFARNANSMSSGYSVTDYASFELESIKIYNGENIVLNGVPAKYGNQAGLYDTVTSTFMPSLGTSDFVAGEETPIQDIINFTNESGYITSTSVNELTDVNLSNLTNGQSLVYNSTSQKWENQTIQSGTVTDVEVNGNSVVTGGVAEIDLTGYQKKLTAGTDIEIVEGSSARLPQGFTEVEYIQCNGDCLIDLGIVTYSTDVIEQKFQNLTSRPSQVTSWFGSMQNQTLIRLSIGYNPQGSTFFGGFNYTTTLSSIDTNIHTIKIYKAGTNFIAEFDGIPNIYTPTTLVEPSINSYLFARNGANGINVTYGQNIRIYYHKQTRNGAYILDLVPCRREADGELGFYNLVDNEFLTSSDNTQLSAGADIIFNPSTIINFTNETGYITGINSTDVTTALGYTPYNATNPNGYTSNVGTVTSVNNELPDANGNVTIDTFSRNIGEIVSSTIPLTDAGLHLLDGALISGSGSYSAFVDYIADIYDGGNYPNLFDTEVNWQSAVTQYGVCEKFVYDSTNNTVRLPKYGNQIYTGGTVPVLGNGMSVGLTTNTNNLGTLGISTDAATNRTYAYAHTPATLPATLNSPYLTNVDKTAVGITTDATKSGIISNPEDISMNCYYYIVVATSTKTDIQVDIDEIATDLNGKADTDFSNVTDVAKIAMANASMPSDTYENLTLGASGTTYTAPADGWFTVRISSTGGTGIAYVTLNSSELLITRDSNYHPSTATNISLSCSIPVKKGSVVTINYSAMPTVSNKTLRFIYAVGSESEAS